MSQTREFSTEVCARLVSLTLTVRLTQIEESDTEEEARQENPTEE
jgi:hypothetical protein